MKLVLYVVSLNAIVLLFPGVRADHLKCFNTVRLDSRDFVYNGGIPKTRASKCLNECIFRSAGVVEEDGLINIQRFMDTLKKLKSIHTIPFDELEMVANILEKCKGHKHFSEDKCETTALLLDCAFYESKRQGYDPTRILRILKAPYYADFYVYKYDANNKYYRHYSNGRYGA